MAVETIDFSVLLKDLPPGAWVAISELDRRVVACASELQAALDQANAQGETDPLVVRVPEQAIGLIV
jgi:hypothetical protein